MRDKISSSFTHGLTSGDERCEALVLIAPSQRGAVAPHEAHKLALGEAKAAQQSFVASLPQGRSMSAQAEQPVGLPIVRVSFVGRAELEELARRPDVIGVVPNQRVRLIEPIERSGKSDHSSGPTDRVIPWNLEALEIEGLWQDAKTRGAGVSVGVIDTGVHAAHPALQTCLKRAVVIDGLGRVIVPQPMFDAGEHGTHVCGVIAGGSGPGGAPIGIAPDTKLCVAGALFGDGRLSAVLAGIAWAVERNCTILNLSLGFDYYEPLFERFLQRISEDFDVVTVAAVGNENHGNTSCPGNLASALSVGAVGQDRGAGAGALQVASFSSGATLSFPGGATPHIIKPDLVAPGVDILSCVPPRARPWGTVDYASFEGSSMAAPHVAGALAILRAARPKAPMSEIVEALRETADHPGSRPDNRWGWGMIRPRRALQALG